MTTDFEELAGQSGELPRLLRNYFRSGPAFTDAYLKYFERSQAVSLRSARDLEKLNPAQQMWFHYALSTNARGRDLILAVKEFKPLWGRRYLDVGCGFGGCLVQAGLEGARCVGIEMDGERLNFSRANIADAGLGGVVELLTQDAIDPEIVSKLGQFDVITCNDVAEHVDDVEQLFRNLGALLYPGGVVYMEVPNRQSIDFVRSDGHFGVFGITLLDRPDARRYHAQLFQHRYDVGDYLAGEEYAALFERYGMQPRLIPSLYHPAHELATVEERLENLARARRCFEQERRMHPDVLSLVLEKVETYCAELMAALPQARTVTVAEEEFRTRYLRDFWTFVAFRTSSLS